VWETFGRIYSTKMPLFAPMIDQVVEGFARHINANGSLKSVALVNWQYSEPARCNENVSMRVKVDGGKALSGWAIWSDSEKYLIAEAHVIWQDPTGNLIDITPRPDGINCILFLEHGYSWPAIGFMPETRYQILEDSLKVRALIAYHRAVYHFRVESGRDPTNEEIAKIRNDVIKIRDGKFDREDCPCFSALRFTSCCGRPLCASDPYNYEPLILE
jgi:hypothetical protein